MPTLGPIYSYTLTITNAPDSTPPETTPQKVLFGTPYDPFNPDVTTHAVVAGVTVTVGTVEFLRSESGLILSYNYFRVELTCTYPDALDDGPPTFNDWVSIVAGQFYANSRRPQLPPLQRDAAEHEGRIALPDVYDASPSAFTTYHAPLNKVRFDWGDGEQSDVLSAGLDDSQPSGFPASYPDPPDSGAQLIYHYYRSATERQITHQFTHEAGSPVVVRAIDAWGRKSAPLRIGFDPVAVLNVKHEPETGCNLVDTRSSYGLTGYVAETKLWLSATPITSTLSPGVAVLPASDLDEDGRVFRLALPCAGEWYLMVGVEDNLSDLDSTTEGGTNADYARTMIGVEHPPRALAAMMDGSLMTLSELNSLGDGTGHYGPGIALGAARRQKRFSTVTVAQYNAKTFEERQAIAGTYPYRWVYDGDTSGIEGASAPCLWWEQGTLWAIARVWEGEPRHGTARLLRSYDMGGEWEEVSMVWEEPYFHAVGASLLGKGKIGIACGRLDAPPSDGLTRYKVALYSRTTLDNVTWTEPHQIAEIPITAPLFEADVQRLYPVLTNEAAATGIPRLVLQYNGSYYESSNSGGTPGTVGNWRQVSSP